MKRTPTSQAYAKPAAARFSLGQSVAKDVGDSLHGALVAIRAAKKKSNKLATRTDFAAMISDLERVERDLLEAKAHAEWLRKGKQ